MKETSKYAPVKENMKAAKEYTTQRSGNYEKASRATYGESFGPNKLGLSLEANSMKGTTENFNKNM